MSIKIVRSKVNPVPVIPIGVPFPWFSDTRCIVTGKQIGRAHV